MDTTIYYFTGTGNSLKVARDLAKELSGASVVNLAKAINSQTGLSAERIGIIFPVYMFGMPLIISRFIKSLKESRANYIFAVATYGGALGNALGQAKKELWRQGLKLNCGFGVRMPGNYTPLYAALQKDKQDELFLQEGKKVKEIAAIIAKNEDRKIEKNNFLFNAVFSGIIYKLASPRIPFLDKDFWADENCSRCGTCAKVCPVNNIKLIDARPVWLHKCEQCFACLHWCPPEAIQYGKNTIGRRRYRHPEITSLDLL